MDDCLFDDLTRALGAGPAPRRAALRLAAGGALATLAGLLRGSEAAAACSSGKKRCGEKCIPASACCTKPKKSRWIAEGGEYRQCGTCLGGKLVKDPVACSLVDPDDCTECEGGTFRCVPAADGAPCKGCGTCTGGLCDNPDNARCALSSCFECDPSTLTCRYRCGTGQYCSAGTCKDCGPWGCGG